MTIYQFMACYAIALAQTLDTLKFKDKEQKKFTDLLLMNLKVRMKNYE